MDLNDPRMVLSDLLRLHPETAAVFVGPSMLCVGCPIAPFHTISDACREYRLDEVEFRASLAAVIAKAERRRHR